MAESPEPRTRRLRDPRELLALAHPLRLAIVELLVLRGPMTATQLAEQLDQTPANCSWHLRKLAEHHFVEEAEAVPGRSRPWRASSVGHRWDAQEIEGEDGTAASDALSRVMLERWLDRFLASQAAAADDDPAWRSTRTLTQTATYLTAEELANLGRAVTDVIRRHEDRLTDPSRRPEGARLVEVVAWAAPVAVGGVR